MKTLMGALCLMLLAGCADTEVVTDSATQSEAAGSAEDAVETFAAGDSATLEIPSMSCQISCFPKIKKTLEAMDAVELVELVPQKDDVAINDHRITVKFASEVSGDDTMQALADAGYDDAAIQ